MIHRLSWIAVGRAICAALRAIAGHTLPLQGVAPSAESRESADSRRMAAEIEAFVLALQADLISAEDFAD